MDPYMVFYAFSCFCFFAAGRAHGLRVGIETGKRVMKVLVTKDMNNHPLKWQRYVDEAKEKKGI